MEDHEFAAKQRDYIGYVDAAMTKAAAMAEKLSQAEKEVEATASALLNSGLVHKSASASLKDVLSNPAGALRLLRQFVEEQGKVKTAQVAPMGKPVAPNPTESRTRETKPDKASQAWSARLNQVR